LELGLNLRVRLSTITTAEKLGDIGGYICLGN